MPDVSKATATRSSRSQRTRMQVAQGQVDPSVSTKRTTRKQQADGITRGQERSNLARSMSDFFPNAVNQVGQMAIGHMAAQQRTKNRAEIERIQTNVRLNPEGAREAVRTNNYSEFLSDESFASQAAVIDTFKSLTAREAALRDFEMDVKGRILGQDATGDPNAVVTGFLEENLKGADPLFAAEYATIITDKSRPLVAEHRQGVLNAQTSSALNKGEAVLRQAISDGSVPTSLQGLQTLRSEMIGALPVPSPVARDKGIDRFESAIIDEAAKGNHAALKMLHMPDPEFDGLSMAARNPEAVEKAQARAIEHSRRVRTVAAEEDLNNLSNRVSLVANGLPGAEAPEDIIADVISHRETHGESTRWRTMRDASFRLIEEEGTADGNFLRAANNLTTNYSVSEWDKAAPSWLDGTAAAKFAKEHGVSEAHAQALANKQLGLRGLGKPLKNQMSNTLLTSTNVEELEPVFKKMQMFASISQRGLEGTHLTPDGAKLFAYMDAAASAGMDPFAAREQYFMNRESAGPAEGYLERRLDDEGRAMGKAGVRALGGDIWSNISDGFPSNGLFDLSYDDLSPQVRREIDKAANTAGHMMHGQPYSGDQVSTVAGKLLQGKLGIELDANGDYQMTLNRTPHMAVGKDGQVLPGALVTEDTLARGKAAIEANPVLMSTIGEYAGLSQDDLTALGHGLAVRSEVNGIPVSAGYVPGSQFVIPTDEVPKGMEAAFFEITPMPDGQSLVRVPDAGEDVLAAGGVTMRYVPETGHWTPRYIDRGTRREAEEVFAPVGGALPTADQRAPTTPEEAEGIERKGEGVVSELRSRGMLATKTDPNLPAQQQIEQGRKDTKKLGYAGDDMTRDPSQSLGTRVSRYIHNMSGKSQVAVDEATGKKAGEGGKGFLVIGNGFRLLEPSSRDMIEAVGANYKRVLEGKQSLSPGQIDHLTRLKVDESTAYLRKAFPDVDMAGHQEQALISLIYSSRWTDKGPTLMTPKLKKAITAGDMKAAADEIRKATRGGHASQLPALKARREDEANLFLGYTQ